MTKVGALPIDDVLPSLRSALDSRSVAVLEAAPGAGKTTRVPLALLNAEWLEGRRIIMLEPRRLAARNAASFMAREIGERPGETIGYRVRGETRVGTRTRIEIVTEGVLARMRASDPALMDYGLVIFDEFHERSLHADLSLGLALQSQQLLRPELRILVMSATLDGIAVAELLRDEQGPAPVIVSRGRVFPVETLHRPARRDERLEQSVSRVVREALAETGGDMLVFLPGAAEQRRVARALTGLPSHVDVHVLHGTQSFVDQEAAIAPASSGRRKIVLATSVAETSLTIEGVRTVVDAGLSRLPRYSPRTGLTRLETVRVSRASADQRRGRAGRVASGWCYRLWDQHEDAMLSPRTRPEIVDADLSQLALELAASGVQRADELRWLDAPPSGALLMAQELLRQLGAIDEAGNITSHGQQMAALPIAPRLAHMISRAASTDDTRGGTPSRVNVAVMIAALLEERDIMGGDRNEIPADIRLRLELLARLEDNRDTVGSDATTVSRDALHRVRESARDILRRVATPGGEYGSTLRITHDDIADSGALLALAYPDRIAQRRTGSGARFLLRNGSGAQLAPHDAIASSPYLAIADLDGAPPEYRIARAAPLTDVEVRELFATDITTTDVVEWDDEARAVRGWRREQLDAIVLSERRISSPDDELVRDAVVRMLRQIGVSAWPWSERAMELRARLAFVAHHDASWPSMTDDALLSALEEWGADLLLGVRSWTELARLNWHDVLLDRLTWQQRSQLDQLAPTHVEVPTGSRIAVNYQDPDAPMLAVRLQELFGWPDAPRLMNGRVPLTIQLLSPAHRPVQVTRDLAGFWKNSYFEVRREMRGRYPRHSWPDDPLTAPPTRRAKPRGT